MLQQREAISPTLTGTHDGWTQSPSPHFLALYKFFWLSPIFSGALQQADTFVGDFLIELEQIPKQNLLCSVRSPASQSRN